MGQQGQLLTVKDLCNRLKRSRASIYRDIKAGILAKPLKSGGSSRWIEADIQDYVDRALAARST